MFLFSYTQLTLSHQNWLTELEEAYHAFILPSNLSCSNYSGLSHAQIAYLILENPWNVANSAFYVASTLIGDGFMPVSSLRQ